jgi:phenylacetate-CoA ligase
MTLAKHIYDHSPVWLQNLMVSAQGLVLNRRRWDVELGRSLLSQLRESQWWSEDQFHDYQTERLRERIKFAALHAPYYQDLFRKEGIDYGKVRHLEDLRNIPFVEKKIVMSRPHDFLAGGRPLRQWTKFFTSGTTGSPMTVYCSRESFTRIWSFVFRLREWAGLEDPIFPKRVQLTGRDIIPAKKAGAAKTYWRLNFPGNAMLMSTSHLSPETVPAYVEAIKRFEPALIDSYPSAILVLGRVGKALGLDLPRPRAIITSAETLYGAERQELETSFGCRAFNQYASTDTGAFISTCECGNLHINPEFGVCEILNDAGMPAKPGEEGEIVATTFCNTEMVLLRYRIGDRAVCGPIEKCPCGRSMGRVEKITGRVDDILFIPDRGFVGRLDPVFKGLSNIYETQIVHESLNSLRLLLVPAPGYNDQIEAELIHNLRKKVGDTVSIEVEKVTAIPRGSNGKFRSVITNCKDQYPAFPAHKPA